MNQVPVNTIEITTKAAEKVKSFAERDGLESFALKVAVKGGGCSGLTYDLEIIDSPIDDDEKTINAIRPRPMINNGPNHSKKVDDLKGGFYKTKSPYLLTKKSKISLLFFLELTISYISFLKSCARGAFESASDWF